MASITLTLMPPTSLEANQVQDPSRVVDLGPYRHLEVLIRVLSAGTGGNVKLQSNVRNEDDGWVDIVGVSQGLGATATVQKSSANFFRFVRWVGDSGVGGNPVAQIDLVAKE